VYSNIPENLQKTRDIWGEGGSLEEPRYVTRGRGVEKWPKKGHVVCVRPLIIHRAVMVGVVIASTVSDTAVSLSTIVAEVSSLLVGWEEISSKFRGIG